MMRRVVTRRQYTRKLVLESALLGAGYAAALVWVGSALVGSFGYAEGYPYWPVIAHLRTDTAGFLAFAVSVVLLVPARYLELRRRAAPPPAAPAVPRPAGVHLLQAAADIAVLLGTGLVIYVSFNEVTHPWTLREQVSHLLAGPSEGTLRVIALAACLLGLAVRRYLRATAAPVGAAAEVRDPVDVAA
jgi:hypothetical protein